MASAEKVMFLGFRKLSIEKELEEATMVHKAFDLINNNWDYLKDQMDYDFIEDFSEVAIKYDLKKEQLEGSLSKATQEWLEASEEYNKEK